MSALARSKDDAILTGGSEDAGAARSVVRKAAKTRAIHGVRWLIEHLWKASAATGQPLWGSSESSIPNSPTNNRLS
jgi:hypothetical protein